MVVEIPQRRRASLPHVPRSPVRREGAGARCGQGGTSQVVVHCPPAIYPGRLSGGPAPSRERDPFRRADQARRSLHSMGRVLDAGRAAEEEALHDRRHALVEQGQAAREGMARAHGTARWEMTHRLQYITRFAYPGLAPRSLQASVPRSTTSGPSDADRPRHALGPSRP